MLASGPASEVGTKRRSRSWPCRRVYLSQTAVELFAAFDLPSGANHDPVTMWPCLPGDGTIRRDGQAAAQLHAQPVGRHDPPSI